LPSPQSYGFSGDDRYKNGNAFAPGYPKRQSYGMSGRPSFSGQGGILPTPDPTVGSAISDEDVALQLMRLSDTSNFSAHGRTSTSTVDDAMSGRAEVSSAEETDEEGEYGSDGERYGGSQESIEHDHEHVHAGQGSVRSTSKKNSVSGRKTLTAKRPSQKLNGVGSSHQRNSSASVSSAPSANGSGVNFQHFQHHPPLGEDEEDLSSKPRCQRCRKSKKGCDRQRPCGRCKDAGIGIEGCISEEETNGRKGRYGRHMGVSIKKEGGAASPILAPVKKEMLPMLATSDLLNEELEKSQSPMMLHQHQHQMMAPQWGGSPTSHHQMSMSVSTSMAPPSMMSSMSHHHMMDGMDDRGKKRKR
jgi:hypothetical protein